MEDELTQPATQQIMDPRRMGRNNSGLDDKDIADVLAILHPTSPSAIKAVENTADRRPELILFRNSHDSYEDDNTDIEEQETIIIDKLHEQSSPRVGNDLALRMSSNLRSFQLGFVFGRNPHSTDIVFGQDSGKRISNQHFRIYVNTDGIVMLEDMSTNGTLVDNLLLKNKDPRFQSVRMLASGSIICINSVNDAEMIKFVVRIPSRVSHMERFNTNLKAFLMKCNPGRPNLQATLQRLGKHQYGGPTMKWDGGPDYNIIGLLGKGAFATVYKLATKMDGKLVAAKELEKRRFMKNGQLDKKIDNEMRIMRDLRHENIVQFIDYHDESDYLYIIMEYVRYGDLQGYLNQNGIMKEPEAKLMAQQILSALGYLHRRKITHRDIKPDNILIADMDPLMVKLSDFGLSKVVKSDETFLKTFCGTLLYCAPEVFPDFDGAASKGMKRRRGVKQQFHSYSSSVDIWSFAAVLWYSLCLKPPFEGISDQTGRAMWENITQNRLDTTPLREVQVSEACINLLCNMMQVEPELRPTEWDCLNHRWLKAAGKIADDPTLQSIAEEDESQEAGEQLSQLSIQEDCVPDSDEEAEGILNDPDYGDIVYHDRQPKRIRFDPLIPRNQIRDRDHDSSADHSFQSERRFPSEVEAEESFQGMQQLSNRPRLFGEIGQSALQSSGILNAHVNEVLSQAASSGEVLPPNGPTSSRQMPSIVPGRPQLDGAFSSPSLLGAESMVRELNMASPQSPVSGAEDPNEPATPKTPEVPQHNSLEQHSQHPSQFSDTTPKSKTVPFSRRIDLPQFTASTYFDPSDPSDPSPHSSAYATKTSEFDFGTVVEAAKVGESQLDDTIRHSTENSSHESEHITAPIVPTAPAELDIKPPPTRLGKLTATADSFVPGLTLMIDQSRTSWGRSPTNTVIYENSKDTRIPKTAFIIFWWSSNREGDGTVQELSQQGKDWTNLDDLHCGIFTCASSGISINGKHLRQKDEKGRALYGHLHTGDVIQVYHDARGTECLKFKCEFKRGSALHPRPAGEAFNIIQGNKLPDS
ncbi:kinase-like protein [Lojkania enalia]|uniref:Autophagy-related protein 1 n=1 Tax=Lojkania enalia TaxID=147567 RepID=A0A9P4NC62_9PLEO|nr:kinase-like protein [Didymosphaeria enalia]